MGVTVHRHAAVVFEQRKKLEDTLKQFVRPPIIKPHFTPSHGQGVFCFFSLYVFIIQKLCMATTYQPK